MIKIIKKVSRLFNKIQIARLILLVVLMVIGAFLEVLGVGLMVPFVSVLFEDDVLSEYRIIGDACQRVGITSAKQFTIVCVVALIVIFVVKDIYLIWEERLQLNFVYENRFRTQKLVLKAYLQKPYEFYLNANTGEVTRAVCDDVNQAYLVVTTVLSMLTNIVMSVALTITIFVISPGMTIAVLLSIVIAVLIISLVVKPILSREGRNRMTASSNANMWLIQSVQGIKEIKVSQAGEYFLESYSKYGKALIKAEKTNALWGTAPKRIIEMITISSVLLVLVTMILYGTEMQDMVPFLGALAMAAVRLLPSANIIMLAINQITYHEKALDTLLENLKEFESVRDAEGSELQKADSIMFSKEVCLTDVVYRYPGYDKKILNGASVVIPKGLSVGIVGESGSGKTTMIDVLLGLLTIETGNVFVDGKNIQDSYQSWLKCVGYIPQSIFLIDDTIKENVMFGKDYGPENDKYVEMALEKAQLMEFVNGLPDGFATKIGDRGVRLSGGQRQRIGIARALFSDPDILVFDEATSALDNETEEAIMESLNRLHGEKTMIIIAHRLTTLKECDLIYQVKNGKATVISKEELGI